MIVCESLLSMRPLTEAISHVLFTKFSVQSIYFFLTNAMPIYTSGQETGVVVDMGFQCCQVLPVVRSRVCIEGFEVCYTGGVHVEKRLREALMEDGNAKMGAKELEDIKVLLLILTALDSCSVCNGAGPKRSFSQYPRKPGSNES